MSQHSLHTSVANVIRDRNLATPGDCLIVAVSGGADSVALLDLLATLPCYSFRLIVAHLNHLLRGPESDGDERFVAELAARYNLPCAIRRVDVRSLASQQRQSLEEAGREARYAFFHELRQQHQAAAIALAHHADDQAETLLLRLLRGAGTSGLAAMAHRTDQAIIRPLLGLHRDELRAYLANHGIPFREDASNQDRSFLRNRIRLELLPLLASYNPAISERLAATADLLADDERLLEQLTRQEWDRLGSTQTGWATLQRGPLLGQPLGLRLRLYRYAIAMASGDLRRIERKHCLALDALLLGGQSGARVALPKGLTGLLSADHLLVARHELLRLPPVASLTIAGPGCYELGNGLQMLVEQASAPADWQALPPHISYVDPSQAPFPWELRAARPAERMQLLGMDGSRPVRDILADAKVPRHLRPCLPLLLYEGNPLWLAPLRRSRLALVPSGQSGALRLTLLGREQLPLFP